MTENALPFYPETLMGVRFRWYVVSIQKQRLF